MTPPDGDMYADLARAVAENMDPYTDGLAVGDRVWWIDGATVRRGTVDDNARPLVGVRGDDDLAPTAPPFFFIDADLLNRESPMNGTLGQLNAGGDGAP